MLSFPQNQHSTKDLLKPMLKNTIKLRNILHSQVKFVGCREFSIVIHEPLWRHYQNSENIKEMSPHLRNIQRYKNSFYLVLLSGDFHSVSSEANFLVGFNGEATECRARRGPKHDIGHYAHLWLACTFNIVTK